MKGMADERGMTAAGSYLYSVHVPADVDGGFSADVWVSERIP